MKPLMWVSSTVLGTTLSFGVAAFPVAAEEGGHYMGQVTGVDVVEHAIEIDERRFTVSASGGIRGAEGEGMSLGRIREGQWIQFRIVEDRTSEHDGVRDLVVYSSPQE